LLSADRVRVAFGAGPTVLQHLKPPNEHPADHVIAGQRMGRYHHSRERLPERSRRVRRIAARARRRSAELPYDPAVGTHQLRALLSRVALADDPVGDVKPAVRP